MVQVDDFFTPVLELKTRFANLVGAPSPDDVAVIPSVSYGMAAVTLNTPLGPGRNVVLVHEQFPANVYPWRRLALEEGGDVRVVAPINPGPVPDGNVTELLLPEDRGVIGYRQRTREWKARGWQIDTDALAADRSNRAYAIPSPARRETGNWVIEPVPLLPASA